MLDVKKNNIEFWDDVLLVIVLYKEELFKTLTYKSIAEAAKYANLIIDLFVYDNSPEPKMFSLFDEQSSNFNIKYCSDTNNSGLSVAYNRGVEVAREKRKRNVLMLDQDTFFPKKMFYEYESAALAFPNISIFAPLLLIEDDKIFSPCTYKMKRGWHPKNINTGINLLSNFLPVNSGVMISMDVFNKVGVYNEKLRVDFIDFQFMEKVRKMYKEFYVLNLEGRQSFSSSTYNLNLELARFDIYVSDVRSIDKIGILDKSIWLLNIIFRMFKLTIKYRRWVFIKTYISLLK
jgi:GT2 family glycosyltransferase